MRKTQKLKNSKVISKRQTLLLVVLALLLLVVSLALGFLVSKEQAKKIETEINVGSSVADKIEVVSSPIDSVPRFKVEQMSKSEGIHKLTLKNPKVGGENIADLKQAFPDANVTNIPETSEYQAIAGLFDRIDGREIVVINAGKKAKVKFSGQARLWLIEEEKTYIVSDPVKTLHLNEELLSYFKKGDLILILNVATLEDGYSANWFVNFH